MIAIAGRSSFVMAHRLGTTRHCDEIIQVERGRVVGTEAAAAGVGALVVPAPKEVMFSEHHSLLYR
jgi:hypothetical protein